LSNVKIIVDTDKCYGCSLCINNCPVNVEIEPQLIHGESPKTDKVIFKLINGKCRVIHSELCLYPKCKLCEVICTGKAIKIVG